MKKIIDFVLISLVLLILVGCTSNEACISESKEENNTTTIKVMTSYGGDDGNRKSFEDAVTSYEEATGNKVIDLSQISNEHWKERVISDFMTGSEPDVLFYFSNADANPFINANKVVSIEEIREKYPDYATNMKQKLIKTAPDGKHYAVPATGFWETLFVNKEVLDKCGVDVPGADYTWNSFLEDCEKIKNNGYTPIACSLFEIPHYWFEFAVMNNGNVHNHLDLPIIDSNDKLVINETSQKWINGLNDIKFLYDSGYFPENTLIARDVETVAMFARGNAAFLLDGSWKVGYLNRHYPENIENILVSYVPGKNERLASHAIGGISMGYFITRKAWDDPEKREAAVKFVFHMTSEEILGTFVTTESTALISGVNPDKLNPLQKSAAEANTSFTEFTEPVQDTILGEAKISLFYNIQEFIKGNITAEEVIEKAMKLNEN